MRKTVAAVFDYALLGLELPEHEAPLVPADVASQGRLAARLGIPLEAVLRRYAAGHTLFNDFVIEAAERHLEATDLKRLLRRLGRFADQLLGAAATAYTEEEERLLRRGDGGYAAAVERLLVGEAIEPEALPYNLDAFHLAAVAVGREAKTWLRTFARSLGCEILIVEQEECALWVWFGREKPIDIGAVCHSAEGLARADQILAFGEPANGLNGWRLSHRQARAAVSVALRTGSPTVRYLSVALQASVLQDEVLSKSLRRLCIDPLRSERNGGAPLTDTLKTYFSTDRNVSSTAAALGLNRNTVANRLRTVERLLGMPLSACATELEVALRLQDVAD